MGHRLRRAGVTLLVGAVVFGAVYGLAASLTIESKSLGAGNHAVAACQSGTLTAEYATEYSASLPGYKVNTVTVTGLEAGCYTKAYKITLINNANASLGEQSGVASHFPGEITEA